MTPSALRNLSITLWGRKRWRPALARFAGTHRTTVYRYLRGELEIPPSIERALELRKEKHMESERKAWEREDA